MHEKTSSRRVSEKDSKCVRHAQCVRLESSAFGSRQEQLEDCEVVRVRLETKSGKPF